MLRCAQHDRAAPVLSPFAALRVWQGERVPPMVSPRRPTHAHSRLSLMRIEYYYTVSCHHLPGIREGCHYISFAMMHSRRLYHSYLLPNFAIIAPITIATSSMLNTSTTPIYTISARP